MALKPISGLHAGTGTALQLDAGMIIYNVTESTFESSPNWDEIMQRNLLGATKGGATFTATPEFRSLLDGVNGSRGNYKNGQVIDSWDISLKATISEITAANIKLILNESADEQKGDLYKHKAKVGVVSHPGYLNGVAWIGKIAGHNNSPMIILLKDVLNVNGVNFTAEDKNTGGIEVEFKAHFDVNKPDDVPFFIYTPGGIA